ncbi:MAG: hypothetical protein FWH05_02665 [Oscillospiraceae bacterium]|nr:hypothetical protein [Oscillospiraceae bacterium]
MKNIVLKALALSAIAGLILLNLGNVSVESPQTRTLHRSLVIEGVNFGDKIEIVYGNEVVSDTRVPHMYFSVNTVPDSRETKTSNIAIGHFEHEPAVVYGYSHIALDSGTYYYTFEYGMPVYYLIRVSSGAQVREFNASTANISSELFNTPGKDVTISLAPGIKWTTYGEAQEMARFVDIQPRYISFNGNSDVSIELLPFSRYFRTGGIDTIETYGESEETFHENENGDENNNNNESPGTIYHDEMKTVIENTAADSEFIRFVGANVVTKSAAELAAQSELTTLVFDSRTPDNKFDIRITLDAALVEDDINVYASTKDEKATQTKAFLDRFYRNNFAVMNLGHDGSYNQSAGIAVKLNSRVALNNVKIYHYDIQINKISALDDPRPTLDGNGFLHFKTNTGGQIIVTDGGIFRR